MEPRVNKCFIVVGGRNSGKTWFVRKTLEPLYRDAGKRLLVLDMVDHPKYADVTQIPLPAFPILWPKVKGGIVRVVSPQIDKQLPSVCREVKNAVCILEDANRYISTRKPIPEELTNMIINSKQINVDMFLLFHAPGMVHVDLFRLCDGLILFRCNERAHRHKDRVPNFPVYEELDNKVMNSPEPYPYGVMYFR
jgi:hypothetical protein